MNETINLLMKHRTIRKFTKDKIRDEDLKMMLFGFAIEHND